MHFRGVLIGSLRFYGISHNPDELQRSFRGVPEVIFRRFKVFQRDSEGFLKILEDFIGFQDVFQCISGSFRGVFGFIILKAYELQSDFREFQLFFRKSSRASNAYRGISRSFMGFQRSSRI